MSVEPQEEAEGSEGEGDEMRRVKVYQLNDSGQWDDKGTGHVSYSEEGGFFFLTVSCEETEENLLHHKIEESIEYQRQGETIITWCEPEPDGIDLALSFQEEIRCNEIWEQLHTIRTNAIKEEELLVDENQSEDNEFLDTQFGNLPPPEMKHLEDIDAQIMQVTTPGQKETIASCLLKDAYIQKLFTLFSTAEDLEQTSVCFTLFSIFKSIFMLNDQNLLDLLLSNEFILDLIATLEYDRDSPPANGYHRHRDFLNKSIFKQVVSIQDSDVRDKITQNYRIQYIKDVILLRYLDDNTLATLQSTMFFNNLLIIQHLTQKVSFMEELFSKLHRVARQPKKMPPDFKETQKNLFSFLQELCNLSKRLQASIRDNFYKKLIEYGLFDVVETALGSSSHKEHLWLWLSCSDILTNIINHDANLIRAHLFARVASPTSLLGVIIRVLISDTVGSGLCYQIAQMLRVIFDPETMQIEHKEAFLDHIYSTHIGKLAEALSHNTSPKNRMFSKYHACELLCYCVHQHGYRIRQFITNHDILDKIATLFRTKGKPNIVCSAIRFFRTCIGLNDEVYIRHIVHHQLFDPIMELFFENGARYNLLNSVIIELINFIRQANIKPLVHDLVMRHEDTFKHIQYVGTFQDLKIRWKQNQEVPEDGPNESNASEDEHDQKLLDDQAEISQYEYFHKDNSDDEESIPIDEGVEKEKEALFEEQTQKLIQKREINTDGEFDFRKLKDGGSAEGEGKMNRLRGLAKNRTIGINLNSNPATDRNSNKRQKV